jgi:hypothetical protein
VGPTGVSSAASTHDLFHVVGPASDTPLDFTAVFQVSAGRSYDTGNGFGVYVDEGSDAFAHGNGVSCTSSICGGGASSSLTVPLRHAVGEPFEISTYVSASSQGFCPGGGGGNVSATLAFQGLPSAYAVVSCQGFTSNPAVPARAKSWGSLKVTYR